MTVVWVLLLLWLLLTVPFGIVAGMCIGAGSSRPKLVPDVAAPAPMEKAA